MGLGQRRRPVFRAIRDFIRDKLIPFFQKMWEKVRDTFNWIKDKISAIWKIVKPIFKAIYDWVKDKVLWIFNQLGEKVPKIWQAIADAIPTAFDKAKGLLATAIHGVEKVIGPVLGIIAEVADRIGLDSVATALRDARTKMQNVGKAPAPKASKAGHTSARASGGLVADHWDRFAERSRARPVGAGFKTGTPTAVVGEGSRHPEYVIPTDPRYRNRAATLLAMAFHDLATGRRTDVPTGIGMADGGHVPRHALGLPNPIDAVKSGYNAVKDIGGGLLNRVKDRGVDGQGVGHRPHRQDLRVVP